MSLSTQTVVSDGSLNELGVSIDFIDRDTITVYFEGVPAPSTTGLWSWVGSTSKFISFTPAVANGVEVTVKRKTNITELVHKYSEGAQFRADSIDESFTQILHAAQEFAEVTATPSDADPLPVGNIASPGISNEFARADHVHVGGMGGGGGTGTDGFSSARIYAYQRSLSQPTGSPGEVVYNFASANISSPATLANGWQRTIPEGTAPLYVTVASASNQTITDTIGANEWTAPVILVRDGAQGLNTATVFVYARTPTELSPTPPTGLVDFNFATGAVTGLNNGWTQYVPPNYNGPFLWVCTATAASTGASDQIAPAEWSAGQLLARDGVNGQNGGADGLSNATFYAYKRSSTKPLDNPGNVTYHFPSASISTPMGDELANGWTKTPPDGPEALYVAVATASSVDVTDDIVANEWTEPQLMGGADGMTVAPVFAYQRTAANVAPTLPSAPVTYTFGTSVATGFDNGWSHVLPATGGSFLWITQATAAGTAATDTIPATEWSAAKLLSLNGSNGTNGTPGTNGADGTRGTVQIVETISGTAWSSSSANAAISAAGYGSPINRDIVTLTNGSSFTQTRFYDFGIWKTMAAYIDGNLLVTGTVAAAAVSAGTFTGQTYRTAASGQRVTINESSNNQLRAYNSSGAVVAAIGGTGGHVYVNPTGSLPGVQVDAQGSAYGVNIAGSGFSLYANNSSQGTTAQLGSAYGGYFKGTTAVYADGIIQQQAYPETQLKGIQSNNITPVTDNTYFCGTLAKRWAGVTSASAVVVSSDSRLKTEVEDTPLGLGFITSLRPVAYKLVEGRNDVSIDRKGRTVETSVPGTRKHYGLIAQEVRAALLAAGQDDAAFWVLANKDDPDSQQALRYEELISPMIAAIKELTARVVTLESKE